MKISVWGDGEDFCRIESTAGIVWLSSIPLQCETKTSLIMFCGITVTHGLRLLAQLETDFLLRATEQHQLMGTIGVHAACLAESRMEETTANSSTGPNHFRRFDCTVANAGGPADALSCVAIKPASEVDHSETSCVWSSVAASVGDPSDASSSMASFCSYFEF